MPPRTVPNPRLYMCFIDKDGYALGIRDELADVIKVDAFKKQMKDIIEYRTMEYYRRRYVEK